MSLVNVKITREINEHIPCQNHTLFQTKKAKTIHYFRLRQLENHTLKCGTYPYSLYIGVSPSPLPPGTPLHLQCSVPSHLHGTGPIWIRYKTEPEQVRLHGTVSFLSVRLHGTGPT